MQKLGLVVQSLDMIPSRGRDISVFKLDPWAVSLLSVQNQVKPITSHTCTCMHSHTHTHTHIHTHIYTHKHIHIHIYAHIHKHTHKHTHTHMCTHTQTHTHTYTHTPKVLL